MLVRWGSLWHLPAFAVLFPVLEAFLLSSAYWMVGPITLDPWWEGKRVNWLQQFHPRKKETGMFP